LHDFWPGENKLEKLERTRANARTQFAAHRHLDFKWIVEGTQVAGCEETMNTNRGGQTQSSLNRSAKEREEAATMRLDESRDERDRRELDELYENAPCTD
jgi:hypothetical protein